MAQYFSISDLAKEFAVTLRTIRFYEEIGLLSPQRQGNARVYSAADRVRLKLILRGKRLGLSLQDSREIIEMYEPVSSNRRQLETLLQKLQERRAKLLHQQEELKQMLKDLGNIETVCQTALSNSEAKLTASSGKHKL